MKTRVYLWSLIALATVSSATLGDEKKLRELEKSRFVAASKAYEAATKGARGSTNVQIRYTLSVCLLNAQKDLDSSDELAAYRGHHERMAALFEELKPTGLKNPEPAPHIVGACEVFRLEAEYWLENAKLRNRK